MWSFQRSHLKNLSSPEIAERQGNILAKKLTTKNFDVLQIARILLPTFIKFLHLFTPIMSFIAYKQPDLVCMRDFY